MDPPLTSPSVSIENIHDHILLMQAIHKLQEKIQPGLGTTPFDPKYSAPLPSASMAGFLHSAVQRFGAWIDAKQKVEPSAPLSQEHIPPLDVLMIWHAYMLSPDAYYADAQGNVPILHKLGGMPWDKLVSRLIYT
jgi:Glycine-rich domain-containing protein-like